MGVVSFIGEIGKNTLESSKAMADAAKALNATMWGGVKEAKRVGIIVKSGLSGADIVVGTSNAIEDFKCQDYVCATIDIIGNVSSAVGMVLGNIPATKELTTITGSVTVGCRLVRYYCKRYGTVWGCAVAAGAGVKHAFSFVVKQ